MNTRKKKQASLSALDQFNNFCKAMAEQELFEAGVFPNARDAGDVHDELTRLARPSVSDENHGQTPEHQPGEAPQQEQRKSLESDKLMGGLRIGILGLSVGVVVDSLFSEPKPASRTPEEQQTSEKEPAKKSPVKKD